MNLYTPDRLYEYLANGLSSDDRELRETIRDIVRDYENSRRELNRIANVDAELKILLLDDSEIDRVLKMVLLFQIVGIDTRSENLAFALYMTTEAEKGALPESADELVSRGVLWLDKAAKAYRIQTQWRCRPRQSDRRI